MTDETQQFPGNSHRAKIEPLDSKTSDKKIEKVTTSAVIERKEPFMKKVGQAFTGDDANSVMSYVMFEVALPAMKTMISDMVSQGVERLLFGGTHTPMGSRRGNTSYTSYNKLYSGGSSVKEDPRAARTTVSRAGQQFRDVIVESRGEAELVLDQLVEIINQYDVATVSDLYQLVGISGTFTEEKWGWTNLSTAAVKRIRQGYLLDLPRPVPLD